MKNFPSSTIEEGLTTKEGTTSEDLPSPTTEEGTNSEDLNKAPNEVDVDRFY